MKTLYFKKGSVIFQEGAESHCAYIVVSGSVEVSKLTRHGQKQVLSILRDNEIFGEMGLIDEGPRSATVSALVDCSVRVLTKEVYRSLCRKNPKALVPILKVLTSRLRSSIEQFRDLQLSAGQ